MPFPGPYHEYPTASEAIAAWKRAHDQERALKEVALTMHAKAAGRVVELEEELREAWKAVSWQRTLGS